jgi:hypothetical protein
MSTRHVQKTGPSRVGMWAGVPVARVQTRKGGSTRTQTPPPIGFGGAPLGAMAGEVAGVSPSVTLAWVAIMRGLWVAI